MYNLKVLCANTTTFRSCVFVCSVVAVVAVVDKKQNSHGTTGSFLIENTNWELLFHFFLGGPGHTSYLYRFPTGCSPLKIRIHFLNPWVQPVCYAYCFLPRVQIQIWKTIFLVARNPWCFETVALEVWLTQVDCLRENDQWIIHLGFPEDLRGNFLRTLIIYSNVRYLSSILPFFTMTLLGHILHNRHGGSSFWHRLVMTSASSVLLLSFGFVSEHETTRNRAIVPSTKWTGDVCTVKEDVPGTYVLN